MSYGTQKPNFGPAYEGSAADRHAEDVAPDARMRPSRERQLIAMLRIALDTLEGELDD